MAFHNTLRAYAAGLFAIAAGIVLAADMAPGQGSAEPIEVGSRKQLFIDNKFIESADNLELVMNPPYQTGELLIAPDQPWEEGGTVFVYSSALKEDGRVRLWYDLFRPTGPGPYDHERRVCYAESDDGVYFTKPLLGLHEVNGSTDNNVVLPGVIGGCAVWVDPNAPPEHRYKTQAKVYHPSGFHMHSSPDGLRWDLFAEVNARGATDTQTIVFWDRRIERYVFYGRGKDYVALDGQRTSIRKVRRQESDNLKDWDTQSLVLEPDEMDLAAQDTPSILPPVDYYGATVFPYEEADRVYIMLAQAFWHFTDRGYDGALGPYTRDVRLAVSRDGLSFDRVGDWRPFLRPGPAGRFDSKGVWGLPNPVRMGDEIWFYYAGTNVDRTQRPAEDRVDPYAPDGERLGGISRAIMRLDGFVSVDAPYEGGELVTPPIRFEGNALELNLDTAGGGSVLVEILDENGEPIPGYTLDDATPLIGNMVRFPVRWGEQRYVGTLAGQVVQLRFVMRDCKLYAFQFVP